MDKYYDKLKTGDPDREVSKDELMSVLGEYLQKTIEVFNKTRTEIFEPKPLKTGFMQKIKKYLNGTR